jgi:hypothetical protein
MELLAVPLFVAVVEEALAVPNLEWEFQVVEMVVGLVEEASIFPKPMLLMDLLAAVVVADGEEVVHPSLEDLVVLA